MRASVVSRAAARHGNGQRAVAVDGAGEHFVAFRLFHRQRLAGDRRLVHVGVPVADDAVERELLARADDHQRARSHALDADQPFTGAIAHQHVARREIEQPADRLAGAIEALRLEPLRRGEQRHHHRRFFVFADRHRADHGDHHQHVDVEREPLDRLPRALRRKHRADDGGGDQQTCDPPWSVRSPCRWRSRRSRGSRPRR